VRYPHITVLFSEYGPLHDQCMATTETVANGVAIGGWPKGPLNGMTTDSTTAMRVRIANGALKCIGIRASHPELEQLIQSTRRKNEELAPLLQHQAHLMCWYDEYRGSGIDATLDLFRLAHMFAPLGVLGVIHDCAYQCLDLKQVTEILNAAKEGAPPDLFQTLFLNVCPLMGEGFTYYVTRGGRELGGRNICLYDNQNLPMPVVNSIIYNVFSYVRGGAVIQVGENMTMPGDDEHGPVSLTAIPIEEYREHIMRDEEDDVLLLKVVR
jgi:hypothetical protein